MIITIISIIFFFKCFSNSFISQRKDILNKMIEIAELNHTETVLDLGTGAGMIAVGFAKNLKDGMVFGVDRYKLRYKSFFENIIAVFEINAIGNTLENAEKNAKIENVDDKCKFISADITKSLNFPNNQFDVIVSYQSLYCINKNKQKKIYKDISRILKPGGKIIFFEPQKHRNLSLKNLKNYFENNGFNSDIISFNDTKSCILLCNKILH